MRRIDYDNSRIIFSDKQIEKEISSVKIAVSLQIMNRR